MFTILLANVVVALCPQGRETIVAHTGGGTDCRCDGYDDSLGAVGGPRAPERTRLWGNSGHTYGRGNWDDGYRGERG
jgi:hypothetical protein